MADYDGVAQFYDQLHGDRGATIRYLKKIFKQYQPTAKTLLSLACGTGTLEKVFARQYQVVGLDQSSGMIDQARKQCPKAIFNCDDMLVFELDERFDIILCSFASVNHLLDFEQWQQLFERVSQHLNPGGLFVFDILTETCLYNLVLNTPMLIRKKNLFATSEFAMNDDQIFQWQIKGYDIRIPPRSLFDTRVQQVSFDRTRIVDALKKHFTEVAVEDPEHSELTDRSELLSFIGVK